MIGDTDSPALELRGLTKSYRVGHIRQKLRPVLRNLDLTVPRGQVFGYLGPNGAGKTTTIQCLLGLRRADGGTARVMGCDSRKLGPEQFVSIGYVSENTELPLWMTVSSFLDYCRPLYPNWDRGFEQKLMALSSFNAQIRELQRRLVGYAEDVQLDATGRILVSPALRNYAHLEKSVVLVGQGNKFELWNGDSWEQLMERAGGFGAGGLPPELEGFSL